MAYVYRHIRLDKNVPFYIGIGNDDKGNYTRAFHTGSSRKSSVILNRIVAKTEYEVEIIIDNITWNEACKKEIEFIKLYGRKNKGTGILANMTDGGEGSVGLVLTDEIKYKIGKAHRGKKQSEESNTKRRNKLKGRVINDDVRDKISKAHKGKKMSEEQKIHLSKINKGKKLSLTTIQKIKETKSKRTYVYIGRKKSEEEKRKIGDFHKGKKWSLGRKWSDEYKIWKSSITKNKIPVIQYTLDMEFVAEHESFDMAAKATGNLRESISRAARKVKPYTRGISKGFIWKLKNKI